MKTKAISLAKTLRLRFDVIFHSRSKEELFWGFTGIFCGIVSGWLFLSLQKDVVSPNTRELASLSDSGKLCRLDRAITFEWKEHALDLGKVTVISRIAKANSDLEQFLVVSEKWKERPLLIEQSEIKDLTLLKSLKSIPCIN